MQKEDIMREDSPKALKYEEKATSTESFLKSNVALEWTLGEWRGAQEGIN